HGDGFVEAINSNTLVAIANAQPGQSGGQIAGQFIQIPVLESPGAVRGGRFGWKNQHASLLSFSSDAYLNEVGITNRFNLVENTSMGNSVAAFDTVPDNQPCASSPGVNRRADGPGDIRSFANCMRSTKARRRDPAHDGATLTFNESILRHAGEATGVINNYRNLNSTQQNQIITFLKSL